MTMTLIVRIGPPMVYASICNMQPICQIHVNTVAEEVSSKKVKADDSCTVPNQIDFALFYFDT